MEARLYADLEQFSASGWQVKGFAPLLLDLPGERGGTESCGAGWRATTDIDWYHRLDTGFAGRRLVRGIDLAP